MPCMQCEVLDVGKYSNPSFGPFSQVFDSIPGFFWLPKQRGCGIFELSTIFAHFQTFPPISSPAWALAHGVRRASLRERYYIIIQPSGAIEETGPIIPSTLCCVAP